MADVTRPDRGQMILVSGLALALAFVALVLILNSAVYTENLATRSDDVPAADALAYREDARDGIGGAIEYANQHDNASESDLEAALEDGIDEWNRLAVQHAALGGRAANTTPESGSIVYGTQLGQNGERSFNDTSDNPDWTVAGGVSEMDRLRLRVNRSGLASSRLDSFELRFRNGAGDTWSLNVYGDDTTTYVHTDDFSGSEDRCEDTNGNYTEIDIVHGMVNGEDCSALDFTQTPPSSYDIEIVNGNDANGTYELVIGTPVSTGNAPYVTPAIRTATIGLHYESPSLQYESSVNVQPHDPGTIGPTGSEASGGGGDGGTVNGPPTVAIDESASAHTSSGSNHDFVVKGTATAAEGRTIASVEVQLYDPSGNLMRTKRESFASSSVAIDVTFSDVKIQNKDSGTYRIVVTAYDDAGQSGTDEWTVSIS